MLAFIARHLERADQITRLIDIEFNALRSAAAMDAEIDAGQTVDGILRRAFLDWMQREIAALRDGIVTWLSGG